ncbi:MAG: CoB--CoM heterodisulfide reductase iron-sulfur subunit A family protein [Elusimicrobia bacterium]|nr:CoB--CoM heterodisulfide reductase iron-sulfur subunit A family protein [Elusimicrobiota bacterium]
MSDNNLNEAQKRVGVYVCHCGGNISDVVDIKKIVDEISKYHSVVVARDYVFMCSSNGQSLIEDDIKNMGINRIVVAACMPSLHELTFRNAIQRAGLNPYLYEHINIREQVSWVHKDNPQGATSKAILLIKAGVEKVLMQDPLNAIRVNAEHRVLIIGGGISGMRAAVSSADNGIEVVIVEKEKKLGGKLNRDGYVYPSDEKAVDIVNKFSKKILSNPLIKVYTESEIINIGGYVGNFDIKIKKTDGDIDNIKAGSIIVATGFDHYMPYDGEYGYKKSDYVLRLKEFIELLSKSDGLEFVFKGKKINSIGFIHCVGSRQNEGIDAPQADGKVNEYCSRVCCTSGIYTMNKLKEKFPDVNVYDVYADIRTYGMESESLYEIASKHDVIFFRRPLDERPQITFEGDKIKITTTDILSFNERLEMEVDMLVLLTGMKPSEIDDISGYLKLSKSTNRFLQEVHPKLRPVEMNINGVFAAGTSLSPMDITESLQSAQTAAMKSAILLSNPDIPLDPFVAVVDEERCTGCGRCVEECLYSGAVTITEKTIDGNIKKVAYVNPAMCKGCGACVAVCSERAIDLNGSRLSQFEAMIDAIVKE